jgi:hypothetical protein
MPAVTLQPSGRTGDTPSTWRARWPWGVMALLPLLLFLRAPHTLIRAQFWAEDATVFFDHQQQYGLGSLLRPHNGYLNMAPRLIALAADPFPVRAAPGFFAWATFTLATATVLIVATTTFQGHRAFGPLAALGFAFVPHLSFEAFWNPTNIQSTLALLLLVPLVADPPTSPRRAWPFAIGAALAAVSTPLSAILLPCLLVRLWLERSTLWAGPLAAAVIGGLVQAAIIVGTGQSTHDASLPSVPWCLDLIGRRVFIQGFVPAGCWDAAGRHAVAAGVIGLGLLAAGVAWEPRHRVPRLLLLGGVGLTLVASIARIPDASRSLLLDVAHTGYGDRYFIPIRVGLTLFLLTLALDARRAVRGAAIAGCCLVPLASLPHFAAPARPDLRWRRYAPRIEAGEAVDVPVLPDWTYRYRPPRAARP